jgi:hypothetical protein
MYHWEELGLSVVIGCLKIGRGGFATSITLCKIKIQNMSGLTMVQLPHGFFLVFNLT